MGRFFVVRNKNARRLIGMKTNTVSFLTLGILFFSAMFFAGVSPVDAAMPAASQLVSMETHSTDLNVYDQAYPATLMPQAEGGYGFPWLSLNEVMLAFSVAAALAGGLFLLYLIADFFTDHDKKRAVRMHSHSSLMHRHITPKHR
ncbi:MAG: hypothetical protein A3C50_02080 [Candidatus Staskawiczbacteria bacterium RIFCSPHIGHO2_02_FULL_43_16]|uniref:Uncharacterized protein n=1 Tax=Candidatus Staskawiczbacteria bacterium RIFCSPHIGHO2_01_FULL_41_41 TaxID=1802203 RepID=A0A1G2HW15_9BACT|nr:MAG: hypothetical protein A2822_00450 [Candidatus Staskawiczbacteria bacterium RIFCSPHIGHO2_01_FULL_41_41]OGZ68466.1 MAG: hypothetical protein A3C50_02080 [Candidatus Staskawiczbacteria bacterium RIFCSPHIGHO2_02_FULL_43_16]OGZ74271.1 MAG: hypothetical protein A3A12_02520 [Candidatus Staskawiczbacteria bacterium RIFCSPLOWO2_01_FULL_43_17b]